jgi:Glycosyltransferase like family
MIAFGAAITKPEPYQRYAEPGIRLAAEPDSAILAFAAVGPVARTYNLILEAAASREDLEALVLVHPHMEIGDPEFCHTIRQALRDPQVGVVGCLGAAGIRSIAWWEGVVSMGRVVHRYGDHGGGDLPAWSWTRPQPAPRDVDAVDGALLVLSPWAVRNVRFDEALHMNYGFDLDYCRQVRAAGHRVVTADVRAVYHHSLALIDDLDLWVQAHMRVAEKWDGSEAVDWKQRARRAEAEREAERAIAYTRTLAAETRLRELERAMDAATDTLSWRATAPLRRLNALRRRLLGQRPPDLVLGHDRRVGRDPRPHSQARQALGDRERARVE